VEILEAFCVELDRVVDIYEAQKAYFAMPELKRARFTFRCSDIDCRREKNPLVSGVNYDKLAEESETYRQIHFRAPKGNPHTDACVWVREDAGRQEPVESDGEERKPRLERAKKTNVIDIFRPKAFDANAGAPFQSPSPAALHPRPGNGKTCRQDGCSQAERATEQQAKADAGEHGHVIAGERGIGRMRYPSVAESDHEWSRMLPDQADHLICTKRQQGDQTRVDRLIAACAVAPQPHTE
jgi:hypothetical protein